MTRRTLLTGALLPLAAKTGVQWITLDLASGRHVDNWPNADQGTCLGSLLKPFLVLSYHATHAGFPVVDCRGSLTGCWLPQGHGRQSIVNALANSCNSYFLQLSAQIDRAALEMICLSYGLAWPPRSFEASRLIGLGGGWPQSPLHTAQAFGRLARNATDPGVRIVLTGMAQCSRCGTARAAQIPCYAKTGTAPCSHLHRGAADGFVVAIYPLDEPRHVLLVGQHNTTGANAAKNVRPLIAALG